MHRALSRREKPVGGAGVEGTIDRYLAMGLKVPCAPK